MQKKPDKKRNYIFLFLLSIILLFAATIRIPGLNSKNLCFWDEGIFLMGAKFFDWRVDVIVDSLKNCFGSSIPIPDPDSYEGYPVFLQKPMHVVLLWISCKIFGFRDYVAFWHSVFYGLMAIGTIAMLTKYLSNTKAGLVAALWMTFQPYHIHYSRLGLHETDSMFLLTVALLAWIVSLTKNSNQYLFFSGILGMMAMGTSYRLFFLIPLIILGEILHSIYDKRKLSHQAIRFFYLFLGIIPVFVFFELLYFSFFSPDYLWSQPASYFALLKKKFISHESSFDLKFPLFYIKMLFRFDGVFPTIVLLFASSYNLIFHKKTKQYVSILFFLPFALFSITSTRLARTPTGLLPIGAAIIGLWMCSDNIRNFKNSQLVKIIKFAKILVVCISIFIMSGHIRDLYRIDSGYDRIFNFLAEKKHLKHLSTMKPISAFYLGRQNVESPKASMKTLCKQVKTGGFRYLIVDWEKYVWPLPAVHEIERNFLPVFASDNPVTAHFSTLHENYLPESISYLKKIDPTLNYIKVYDLYEILPAYGCDLNLN